MLLSGKNRRIFRERFLEVRNRLLSSPTFQRRATRFPLSRFIARRRARNLFDLAAGFIHSQILVACIETGLLAVLGGASRSLQEIESLVQLPPASIELLLRGAAALDLVERLDDRWSLGRTGAELLGSPGVAAMIAHHRALYADLADPVGLLRRGGGGGELSRLWRYTDSPDAAERKAAEAYSSLMAVSQPMISDQAISAYDFRGHRRLLDIGGGEGAFIEAITRSAPDLSFGLFDLPAVVARARERFGSRPIADRVQVFEGNFLADTLPSGFDLVTLVRVLHDHDDAPALALLRRIHAALPVQGRLLIVEPMAEVRGVETVGDAYFAFYLLAMGSGRPRSAREIRAMLREAGFQHIMRLATNLPVVASAIVATR